MYNDYTYNAGNLTTEETNPINNEGIMISGGFGGGIACDVKRGITKGLGELIFPDMNSIFELIGVGSEISLFGFAYENSGGMYSGTNCSLPGIDLRISVTKSDVKNLNKIYEIIKPIIDYINNCQNGR